MRPDAQERRETGKVRKAPPSAVLSFAAPIEAGKTTVSTKVAAQLVAPRVSFGDYLRGVARDSGLEMTREVLQDLGDKLVSRDVRRFCEDVLEQEPWEPGQPLIIDGVRHVEVLDSLSEILSPARAYLIYINVDRTTQVKRLKIDPLRHEKTLDELEKHPTEEQVRSRLPDRAALVIDGTQDPDESTRQVIEFLASKEREAEERGWDEKNARRIELAEKKSRGELSGAELSEFDRLQTAYFDYLAAKYPRTPVDLDRLAEIERRLKASEGD
jgi:adenylate kinase family enzyme